MTHDENLTLTTTAVADGGSSGNHAYRIVASGDIDLHTAPRLTEAIEALIADGALLIALDASEIEFLDSSGLRVIVNCANKLSSAGGRLLIEGMSGAVQRVLEITGLIDQYRA